jgi:UDP-N-acetylmuramate dehydrogenase
VKNVRRPPSEAPVLEPRPLRGRLVEGELLSAHTSWRVGGPADRFYEPADRADLLDFIATLPKAEPVLWLGLGSNLLVRDGGFRGTVIALHGALTELASLGEFELFAEAGVHCARLAKFAQRQARAGLGFLAGIPGTVGGALAMNAGAWGGETWPCVSAVEVVYRDGRAEWLPPQAFKWSYRHVEPPAGVLGYLAARLRVAPDTEGAHERATREWLAQRRDTQPVGRATAGSTFRNPVGDFAARLIDACGLKRARIGAAEVSDKHANFIVTDEGATASDVERLIGFVREQVYNKTGIALVPEVQIVGEPAHG